MKERYAASWGECTFRANVPWLPSSLNSRSNVLDNAAFARNTRALTAGIVVLQFLRCFLKT
jgi:hypothetical protein